MRKHIDLARQETAPVLEEGSSLISQKQEVETKQQLLEAFNKHFVMSDDDVSTLTSPSEPVNERFFFVLARLKRIHRECEVLLGSENQRLGLEVMEQSSKHLNAAFQKLYRWIQKEFKTLNLEDPHISATIRQALRVLAERPTLFQSCLDFFAEAREHILSDAFYSALTDAGPDAEKQGATKAIEFSAHDPLRYIGDMLAGVHSAAVSEREALEALFISDGDEIAKGIQAGINSEPWYRLDREEESAFDGHKALNELVNRDLSGVSRALRQRIELVVQGHEEVITVYKIINLLTFYNNTFTKLVGSESSLVETILSLEKSAFAHFESLMQDQLALVESDPSLAPPADLSIPPFLSTALDQLNLLMKAYETSFRPSDSADDTFTIVLHAALDPFLDLCSDFAKSLADVDTTNSVIFHTNYLLAVHNTLLPFPFAVETSLPSVDDNLSELKTQLLDIQHAYLLHTSGLHPLLSALAPLSDLHEDLTKIHDLDSFQPSSLSQTSQQLDDFLPSALMDATENLKRLQSPKMVKEVTETAAERFCEDFEFVEGRIIAADELQAEKSKERMEDEEEEEGPERTPLRTLFPRTSGEIRVLLS